MPVLLIIGSGPGISRATARRFGAEGYSVALVGRDPVRLEALAAGLRDGDVDAVAYAGDAADPSTAAAVVDAVHRDLGTVSVILFTAFGGGNGIGDVLAADPASVVDAFRLSVPGLLAVVQAALSDLRSTDGSAVLAATGAVGENRPEVNAFVAQAGLDGLALEAAAKSKLLGLLAERLRGDGIHVGEIVINGTIEGSAYATPTAISPDAVAERFWSMVTTRAPGVSHLTEGE